MSLATIHTRIEAILNDISTDNEYPSGKTITISGDVPVGKQGYEGYVIAIDLPSNNGFSDISGNRHAVDEQTWNLRIIGNESSSHPTLIGTARTDLFAVADAVINRFLFVRRLELNNAPLAGIESVALGRYRFTVEPYPARDSRLFYQVIIPLQIMYKRKNPKC